MLAVSQSAAPNLLAWLVVFAQVLLCSWVLPGSDADRQLSSEKARGVIRKILGHVG